MNWLATGDCAAAQQFGWLMGSVSGVLALAAVIALIASAQAYHRDVPRAVRNRTRTSLQKLLRFSPLLLVALWVVGGCHAGKLFLACYATSLSLATTLIVAPIMLLLMFTTANFIGQSSAR